MTLARSRYYHLDQRATTGFGATPFFLTRDDARREQLRHLFMKIDANSDGTVDWDELTNHLMLEQARQLAHADGDVTGDELYVAPPTKSQGSRVRKRRTKVDLSTDKTTQFLAAQAASKKGGKTDMQVRVYSPRSALTGEPLTRETASKIDENDSLLAP